MIWRCQAGGVFYPSWQFQVAASFPKEVICLAVYRQPEGYHLPANVAVFVLWSCLFQLPLSRFQFSLSITVVCSVEAVKSYCDTRLEVFLIVESIIFGSWLLWLVFFDCWKSKVLASGPTHARRRSLASMVVSLASMVLSLAGRGHASWNLCSPLYVFFLLCSFSRRNRCHCAVACSQDW